MQCNRFNLPIIIIAQNWDESQQEQVGLFADVRMYDKPLGIVGARKELRRVFLESEYDCLIMLDDDCIITATNEGIKRYLDEIDEHQGCVGLFRNTLLKLFCISKDIFSQVDFRDDINAEDGTGFEDTIFVSTIVKQFKGKVFNFSCRYKGIDEISVNAKDPLSTWYTNQNLSEMLETTHRIVNEMK